MDYIKNDLNKYNVFIYVYILYIYTEIFLINLKEIKEV